MGMAYYEDDDLLMLSGKLARRQRPAHQAHVAPRAGAWIETSLLHMLVNPLHVAPHAGAWIET